MKEGKEMDEMKDHNKWTTCMWLKNIALIVSIICAIAAIWYYIYIPNSTEPSFTISIDAMEDSLQQGGILQRTVTVKSLNNYDTYTVSLSADCKKGNLPEGITMEFQPSTGGPKPSYTASLLISVRQDVPIGEYELLIRGTGSTGYETSCSYLLKVTPGPESAVSIDMTPESELTESPTESSETPSAVMVIPIDGIFYPSGMMGDYDDLTYTDASAEDPYSGATCIQVTYSAEKTRAAGWAGVYWQYPENNWGEIPGYDLTGNGLTKLTFWAKGKGFVKFKVGGINDSNNPYHDSITPAVSSSTLTLDNSWTQYTIDLTNRDMSNVIGGFCLVVTYEQNADGCTVYLDDIQFE